MKDQLLNIQTPETQTPECTEELHHQPRSPRTLNAFRHGLTGQVYLFTPEDQRAYEHLCKGMRQSLAPVGFLEEDLVDAICDDRWRLKRAAAIENQIFADSLTDPDTVISGNAEVDGAFAQARAWKANADYLTKISLHEHRIQRRMERNLELLRKAQAERKGARERMIAEVEHLTQEAARKGQTYDPKAQYPTDLLPPDFDFSTYDIERRLTHRRALRKAA